MQNNFSKDELVEFRCEKCGKLLLKHAHGGDFEIKCNRCGTLNRMFEEMSEQVIITDAHGVILFVNKEVERITGYGVDEVIGKTPAVWGGQMSPEFYQKLWKTILEEKKGIQVKVTNRHKDRHLYNVLLRISPVIDLQGEVKFFVGFESLIRNKPGGATA